MTVGVDLQDFGEDVVTRGFRLGTDLGAGRLGLGGFGFAFGVSGRGFLPLGSRRRYGRTQGSDALERGQDGDG